jgi:hypothetical protein
MAALCVRAYFFKVCSFCTAKKDCNGVIRGGDSNVANTGLDVFLSRK